MNRKKGQKERQPRITQGEINLKDLQRVIRDTDNVRHDLLAVRGTAQKQNAWHFRQQAVNALSDAFNALQNLYAEFCSRGKGES